MLTGKKLPVTNYIVSTSCKGWSSLTSNVIALGCDQGCSTNIHSTHSGLWQLVINSNHLHIAQVMTLWVDIHVSLMFIVIWLQMEELGGNNVGKKLPHQPYSSWVAWGSWGLKKVTRKYPHNLPYSLTERDDDNRGCHTSFLPFSEVGEWWSGTLSLNGGGPILGEWKT